MGLLVAPARRRRIFGLALPIIGGMVSQNVLNLVDTGMVGTLGDEALFAVGLGGFLNFLLSAAILGLGAGVQAMAARRVGEGRHESVAVPLNGGLLLAALAAVPLSAGLITLAPHFVPWFSDDAAVVAACTPYLQVRLVAMAAMAANVSFRGFWNATDRSALYMGTLVVMHAVNIGLNWVLIFGNLGAPALGSTGAGVASAIATWIGTFSYVVLGARLTRGEGFLRGLPDRETLRTMLRLSVPAGTQQLFYAGGITLFITFIGRVGTAHAAASKVISDLMLLGILPGLGFGRAAASRGGQALGRGEADDAERWGWEVARLAALTVGLLSLPAILVPDSLLSVFLHDEETLALARGPLRLVGLFLATDTIGSVLQNACVGAGDTRRAMQVSVTLQWLLLLPLVYVLGPVLGASLLVLWGANVLYRQLQTGVFVALWRRGSWKRIEV